MDAFLTVDQFSFSHKPYLLLIYVPTQAIVPVGLYQDLKIIEIVYMRILLSILQPNEYIYDIDFIKYEIINYQLPRYNNGIVNMIKSHEATLGHIFQYCGRLYVCKKCNGNLNIKNIISKEVYEIFPDIFSLYSYLSPLQTYDDVSPHLEELTLLLCNFI